MENIQLSTEVKKNLKKFDIEESIFINQAERYISAITDGRMCCVINSVSKSGMSRTMKFIECSKSDTRYHFMQFYALFKVLGFSNKEDYFRINGCGMDMVFHTNYTIIRNLFHMGFINKETCSKLEQKTPTVL